MLPTIKVLVLNESFKAINDSCSFNLLAKVSNCEANAFCSADNSGNLEESDFEISAKEIFENFAIKSDMVVYGPFVNG